MISTTTTGYKLLIPLNSIKMEPAPGVSVA
jgi:hypothetical protein